MNEHYYDDDETSDSEWEDAMDAGYDMAMDYMFDHKIEHKITVEQRSDLIGRAQDMPCADGVWEGVRKALEEKGLA